MEHLQPHTMCISKMVRVFDKYILSLPNYLPNLQRSLIFWNWWQTVFAGLCSLRETKKNQSFQSKNAQTVIGFSTKHKKRGFCLTLSQCVAVVCCVLHPERWRHRKWRCSYKTLPQRKVKISISAPSEMFALNLLLLIVHGRPSCSGSCCERLL